MEALFTEALRMISDAMVKQQSDTEKLLALTVQRITELTENDKIIQSSVMVFRQRINQLEAKVEYLEAKQSTIRIQA